MKIEDCTVDVGSKKELYDVETICFAQDIVWCGSGRDHLNVSVDKIEIKKDMSITHKDEPKLPNYTADEFIKKFGENTKSKHRIKTKEEFINEFGDNWEGKAAWNSSGGMDYLFGHELTDDEEKKYLSTSWSIMIDDWILNTNTITEIKQTNTQRRKTSIIDKFISTPKVTLSDSLYKKRKVNLEQNK